MSRELCLSEEKRATGQIEGLYGVSQQGVRLAKNRRWALDSLRLRRTAESRVEIVSLGFSGGVVTLVMALPPTDPATA
jgi:hypothetical protein